MFSIHDVRPARKEPRLRIVGLAFAALLVGCVNLDTICPHKPITHAQTTRGGYQFNMNPAPYILCAKTVCDTVTVPMGIVELSATDATAGLTWNQPVAVPPAQTIGPCKYGA